MKHANDILMSEIEEAQAVVQKTLVDETFQTHLQDISTGILKALQKGKKILLFGNGGSAADAQHIAGEFVGKFRTSRPAIPAIALTTDTSFLTAWSNDEAFDFVFARQIEALGNEGDIAWALSTSGGSRNVFLGLQAARRKKMTTIGFLGKEGSLCSRESHYTLYCNSLNTARCQEIHQIAYHSICAYIDHFLSS